MVPFQEESKISPFRAGNVEYCFQWANDNGFAGIEPILSDPANVDVQEVRKLLFYYGLSATTIVTGQHNENLSLCTDNKCIREITIERMIQYIEFAHDLECMVTVGLIKGSALSGSREENMERLCDSMNVLLSRAQELGVTILLEPINHMKSKILNSTNDVNCFINKYFKNRPIKLLWDSYQSEIEDLDVIDSLHNLGDNLGHVHFADTDRLFPGEGKIDFVGIYKKLVSLGYEGYITLECFNKPDREHILNNAVKMFENLELCINDKV